MATVDEIARLRLIVAEDDETVYTDTDLGTRIDAATGLGYSLNLPARDIWAEKAARYALLVDMSEGGSSRSNGQIFERAKSMASMYSSLVSNEAASLTVTTGVVIGRLTR